MRNTFLLGELILESRLDDVIKKYPEVSKVIIEELSKLDPSGNNKYLDWMVYGKKLGVSQDRIVKGINLFHKNINKLNKDFLDELIKEKNWGWLLTDNSPVGKIFQNIYKNPKDINAYKDYGLALDIFKRVDEKLSKADIKKLEANVLYNDSNLLILIPKSHRASCFYGSGTKWCTTSKDSDSHFKRYTTDGTLIYVINKKELETNPWYKTAFLIKNNGEAQAFDAPDNPTSIQKAAENLGSNWDKIKDVIIEYLFKNNLKGIDNFYIGQDLIAWLESKGLDPLKSLSSEELTKKIGFEALVNYLKKRNTSVFEYFSFGELTNLLGVDSQKIKEIWEGYKSVGINPLIKMFDNIHHNYLLTAITEGLISLDEFLNAVSDPNFKEFLNRVHKQDNIFGLLNKLYGSNRPDDWWGSRIGQNLMLIFKDVDLIFGYAKSIGVNLFDAIDVRGMNILLKEKFPMESNDPNEKIPLDRLKYTLNNIDYLKGVLENYGFPTAKVLEYLGSIEDGDKILNELLSKKLINNLSLDSLLSYYKNPKQAFIKYLEENYNDEDDIKYNIEEILDNVKTDIKKVFSNIEEFDNFISDYFKQGWSSYSIHPRTLWYSFFERNYYQLYLNYLKRDKLNDLNILILIKAYQDAPVDENTGLKELVLSNAGGLLAGDTQRGLLFKEGENYYVAYSNLGRLSKFFYGENDVHNILDDVYSIKNAKEYGSLGDVYYYLDNPEIKKEIKEFLFNNFRNKIVTLTLDWVDEFDNWADNIDDVSDEFEIALYDERIEGMSDYQLQSLIEHSPELRKLNVAITKAYEKAYNNLSTNMVKNHVLSMIEDVFGGDFVRQKEIKTQNRKQQVYTFKYDYLIDDIEAYAEEFVWYEDDLPSSVDNLISYLMDSENGRFDGYLNFTFNDMEDFLDNHTPNPNTFIEEFADVLHTNLVKLSNME